MAKVYIIHDGVQTDYIRVLSEDDDPMAEDNIEGDLIGPREVPDEILDEFDDAYQQMQVASDRLLEFAHENY